MGTSAFVLGFFVAIGGWTASKLTKKIDDIIDPPKIESKVNQPIETPKIENKDKEKENVGTN